MTDLMKKLKAVNLPPQQREELGLKKNWQELVPDKFVSQIAEKRNQYRKAMEELKKH